MCLLIYLCPVLKLVLSSETIKCAKYAKQKTDFVTFWRRQTFVGSFFKNTEREKRFKSLNPWFLSRSLKVIEAKFQLKVNVSSSFASLIFYTHCSFRLLERVTHVQFHSQKFDRCHHQISSFEIWIYFFKLWKCIRSYLLCFTSRSVTVVIIML